MKNENSPFILCDHLIAKTDLTYLVELLCELFYDSRLLTIAHKTKEFVGVIEQRKICSTYLSAKKLELESLYNYQLQLPFLLKTLVENSYSHGVVVTNGHLLPMSRLANIPLTFLLMPNHPFEKKYDGWKRKLWKGLERPRACHKYFVFYQKDKKYWEERGFEVQYLPFPMRLENILFKKELEKKEENFVWLEGYRDTLPLWFNKISYNAKTQGKGDANEKIQFIEQDCSGDLSEPRNEATFHIDLEQSFFPRGLLQALGSGCPTLIHRKYEKLISENWKGVGFYDETSFEENIIKSKSLNREELRQQIFPHHSLRLKKKLYEWSLENSKTE